MPKKYKLKIQSLQKGWQEWDEVMLHSIFQCIANYVDKEIHFTNWFQKDEDFIEESEKPYTSKEVLVDTRGTYYKIMSLYEWWKKYVNDPDSIFGKDPLHEVKSPEIIKGVLKHKNNKDKIEWIQACKLHEEWEKRKKNQITEKMIEAIKIRYYLWS